MKTKYLMQIFGILYIYSKYKMNLSIMFKKINSIPSLQKL